VQAGGRTADAVDATNWRAEHALRPAVATRKVCSGNRSARGAQTHTVLASVLRTIQQRQLDDGLVFSQLLRSRDPIIVLAPPLGMSSPRRTTRRLVYNRRQMTLLRLSAIARCRVRELACREKACMVAFPVALMIASATSCRAVPTPQADRRYVQQLQPLLEQFVQWQEIPGLAIGIVEHNQLVYAHAFGVKHLERPADTLTTRSLFHMASITKPFVGTAIMQLVERGIVDLDAPAVKYLSQLLPLMAEDVVFLSAGQPTLRGRGAFATHLRAALKTVRLQPPC